MLIAVSWRDGRVKNLQDVVVASRSADFTEEYLSLLDCHANISKSNPSLAQLKECQSSLSAPSSWKSNCVKPCFFSGEYICCDLIWMPNLKFGNAVYFPQDRPIEEAIYIIPGNSTSPYSEYNGTGGVIRTVQIQGSFSAGLRFQKFPFDSQKLIVKIEKGYSSSDINLIASGISKGASGLFQNKEIKSDELPSWAVTKVELFCPSEPTAINIPDFHEKSLDPNDLLAEVAKAEISLAANSTEVLSLYCNLEIHVNRLSSYYLWNTLFPLVCIVHLSFLPIFVSPEKLDLRMTTTVTLFLALTALQFSTNAELPSSSYLTAYHKLVLTSYCLLVVVAVEYLLAYTLCTWKQALDLMGGSKRERRIRRDSMRVSSGTQRFMSSRESEGSEKGTLEGTEDERLDGIKEGSEGSLTEMGGEDSEKLSRSQSKISKLSRRLSMQRVGKVLDSKHKKLRNDSSYGFRFARGLDWVAAVTFPLAYWVAILVIFS